MLGCFFIVSCTKKENTLFRYVDSDHSGITFSNTIVENDSINIIEFQYAYNGNNR